MRTVRDSIRDAIDRSLTELKSKPAAEQAAFAAKSLPHGHDGGVEKLLNDAREALKDVKDEDLHDVILHVSDPNVALLLSALESAPASKDIPSVVGSNGAIIGVHKYDQTDPRWILSALNMLVSEKVPFPQPSGPNDQ